MALGDAFAENISDPAMVPLRNEHSGANQTTENQISHRSGPQAGDDTLGAQDVGRRDDLHRCETFAGDPLRFALVNHNGMTQDGSGRERGSFTVIQGICCAPANKACEKVLSLVIKLNEFEQSVIGESFCHFSIVSGTEAIGDELVPDDGARSKRHSKRANDIRSLPRRVQVYDHAGIDDEVWRNAT